MKSVLFSVIAVFICILACPEKCCAQRTSNGTSFIGATQMVSAYVIPSGGLDIHFGQYLLNSYWKTSLSAVDWMQKTDVQGVVFDRMHLVLEGGWMYRLAKNYSRSFNLYAGGGAFLGYNFHEVFAKLPKEMTTDLPNGDFIYGLRPSVEMECFISRKVALTMGVQAPLTFSSSFSSDLWHVTGSLGIRINI